MIPILILLKKKYAGIGGLSQSSLEKIFAEAQRTLDAS